MTLTNKLGYPDVILKAIVNDPYDKGESDFSATGLIAPARQRALMARHKDEIVTDADDHIWKLFGQIGHLLLERSGRGLLSRVTERRFFTDIEGVKISAQIDSLSLDDDGTLIDWKYTSVYGFMLKEDPKWEWVAQLNIQLELLRRNGFDAKKLQIWGVLRDWRPKEKRLDPEKYPNKLGFHDIPIVPREKIVKYIESRIVAHRAAEKELPYCTPKENWYGRRCSGYCDVANFCTQYQRAKERKKT